MNNVQLIKEYFYEHAKSYGFILKNKQDLIFLSYSANDEVYGIRTFFLGDTQGFKLCIKKGRNSFYDVKYRERVTQLAKVFSDSVHHRLEKRIIFGNEIDIYGEKYVLQNFVNWNNAYFLFRNPLIIRNKLSLIQMAFDFCHRMESSGRVVDVIDSECERIFEVYKKANASAGELDVGNETRIGDFLSLGSRGLKIGLIHNDLVPSNFLVAGGEYRVIDWEYWDTSLSIFNFFDVVLSFGSLWQSMAFSRRSENNYWKIFTSRWSGRGAKFLKLCGEYCERVGYLEIAPDLAGKFFLLYLMNKSVCQYKVYGSRFNFDKFWFSLLRNYYQYTSQIYDFWNNLIYWRSL